MVAQEFRQSARLRFAFLHSLKKTVSFRLFFLFVQSEELRKKLKINKVNGIKNILVDENSIIHVISTHKNKNS